MKNIRLTLLAAASTAILIACGNDAETDKKADSSSGAPAFESTYNPQPSESTLITNARIIDGTGQEIENANLLITNGKISAIGTSVSGDAILTIDAKGKYVTPGIIDIHSHLGNYPSPSVRAHGDGNEVTSPITSEVWAEHGVWPQDPGFDEALQGGVTTLHVLPGSANLFGGRGVTLRNVASRTVQGMKFPQAPYTLKMACGENPKRVYGQKGGPGSRMGNVAGYRKNWIKAQEYQKKRAKAGDDFKRDLQLETLADVLDGEISVSYTHLTLPTKA